MTLRERLIALADSHEIGPTAGNQDECREVALAAAKMALDAVDAAFAAEPNDAPHHILRGVRNSLRDGLEL